MQVLCFQISRLEPVLPCCGDFNFAPASDATCSAIRGRQLPFCAMAGWVIAALPALVAVVVILVRPCSLLLRAASPSLSESQRLMLRRPMVSSP